MTSKDGAGMMETYNRFGSSLGHSVDRNKVLYQNLCHWRCPGQSQALSLRDWHRKQKSGNKQEQREQLRDLVLPIYRAPHMCQQNCGIFSFLGSSSKEAPVVEE